VPDDPVVPGLRRPRALPPEAIAGLRDAFASEVAARLPRLRVLLDGPPGPDCLRDAHALGSSAVVVGELDASRTARALEAELAAGAPDPDRCAELVRALDEHLTAWTVPAWAGPA
jgi:HPt (histidine-containing phosphotransfer) domain-containing protein